MRQRHVASRGLKDVAARSMYVCMCVCTMVCVYVVDFNYVPLTPYDTVLPPPCGTVSWNSLGGTLFVEEPKTCQRLNAFLCLLPPKFEISKPPMAT